MFPLLQSWALRAKWDRFIFVSMSRASAALQCRAQQALCTAFSSHKLYLTGFNPCKRGYIHIFCSISEFQWANSGRLQYEEFFPLCWMFSGLSQFPWTFHWWVLSRDQWEQTWHVLRPGGPASTEGKVGSLEPLEPNTAHSCPGCFWTGRQNNVIHRCSDL